MGLKHPGAPGGSSLDLSVFKNQVSEIVPKVFPGSYLLVAISIQVNGRGSLCATSR